MSRSNKTTYDLGLENLINAPMSWFGMTVLDFKFVVDIYLTQLDS